MTAELIMPTLAAENHFQAPQPRHFQHHHQQPQQPPQQQQQRRPQHMRSFSYQVPPAAQQISPLSTSGESEHHTSVPASPNGRHARGFSQARPMFMPAVLRPNSDFIPQPLTSSSPNGSHDSDCECHGGRRLSNSSTLMNMAGIAGMGVMGRLSRRATADNNKCPEGHSRNHDGFPAVTQAPTRAHWKVCCPDPTWQSGNMSTAMCLPCTAIY